MADAHKCSLHFHHVHSNPAVRSVSLCSEAKFTRALTDININMDFQSKPYARVRLVGYWPISRQCRNIPLHWLQDWPRALDPQAHIFYAHEAPAGSAVFHCFHSPRGFDAKPTFRGIPLLRSWDETGRTSAVYNVNVMEVVQPDNGPKALAQLRHAHVRLVTDGTRLTVPVAWLDAWNTLRLEYASPGCVRCECGKRPRVVVFLRESGQTGRQEQLVESEAGAFDRVCAPSSRFSSGHTARLVSSAGAAGRWG